MSLPFPDRVLCADFAVRASSAASSCWRVFSCDLVVGAKAWRGGSLNLLYFEAGVPILSFVDGE